MDDAIAKVMNDKSYSAAYNEALSRGNLVGSRCLSCSRLFLPPHPFCPNCHADSLELVKMKGTGKIVACTVIKFGLLKTTGQKSGKQQAYCCGIIELDEGVRITALITGIDPDKPEDIAFNTPVTVEFITYGNAENKKTILTFRKLQKLDD